MNYVDPELMAFVRYPVTTLRAAYYCGAYAFKLTPSFQKKGVGNLKGSLVNHLLKHVIIVNTTNELVKMLHYL